MASISLILITFLLLILNLQKSKLTGLHPNLNLLNYKQLKQICMIDFILITKLLMETQNSRTLSFVSEMKMEMKFPLATLMMTVSRHVQLKVGIQKAYIIFTLFDFQTVPATIMLFIIRAMVQLSFMTHKTE